MGDLIDGRYQLDQEVGRGGMGVVVRAFDTRLKRVVALKFLPPDCTHHTDRLRRLAAEARAASALNHAGIATVYDFVERGADSFIVYEYIEGRTLRSELSRDLFGTDDVVNVGVQLADALVAAHSHGITHRDLKPENMMLVPDDHSRWRVKILDFGLAKQMLCGGAASEADTISIATVPGLLVGTITYMAPEQLESRLTDGRTDIYALGLVLYEMATGKNPFVGRTVPSTIANILKQEPPPLRQKDPSAPVELERILSKCLRKNSNERYQSARELLVDLNGLRRNLVWSSVGEVPATTHGSAGPLHRFFLLFGATPERRWEILHWRMFLWCMVLAYLGWKFMATAVGRWGLVLFLVELVCILFMTIMLSFLLYTRAVDPDDLPDEVRKLAPWIRGSTFALVLVNWTMFARVVVSHPILATLLGLCSTAGGLKYTLFKTASDRAMLPKVQQESAGRNHKA